MWGLSLVAASGGHSSSRCAGLSLSWSLLLRSTGSRRTGSVVVAHRPSCSAACGIFPDQGSNPCPLHWQANSQPLHHQGSPLTVVLMTVSLTASDVDYPSTCIFAVCTSSSVECLFVSYAHFLIRLGFYCWVLRLLCMFWILVFCQTHGLQFFPPNL